MNISCSGYTPQLFYPPVSILEYPVLVAESPFSSTSYNTGARYADDTTLLAESEEELKSLLMKVKVESEKGSLKLNIQKTKIMASGPITSWEIEGKQWKQRLTLFFGAPKSLQMVTAAMKLKDAYSLEGKL